MNFIPLVLLALTLFFIGALYYCFHRQAKRQYTRSQPSPGCKARRTHYAIVPLVILGSLAALFMITLIAYCAYIQTAGGSDTPTPETPPPVPEESQPADPFDTSQPLKSTSELFPDFHLSAMTDSKLLELSDKMIQGESLTFDLISEAEEQFKIFLAKSSHPASFFPYYNGLEEYFPAGDEVVYTFDDVVNRDQCNAQLRGAGTRLEDAKNGSSIDKEQIVKSGHQMAVRALDAMGFTKYPNMQKDIEVEPETESQQKWHIWLYAEIFLPSQLNSYIYSLPDDTTSYSPDDVASNLPDDTTSYKWHYSFGKMFDYLGGIADSEKLRAEMYFSSSVFLHHTYELMEEGGFQISFKDNDHKIWELYVEMLYRVAARGEGTAMEDFFKEIQRVEDTILAQPFPEEILDSMSQTLNTLKLYTDWRDNHNEQD